MLFHLIRKVDNRILWMNLLLLFCISLIPFFTAFMGENRIGDFSVGAYSAWAEVCAFAFLGLLLAIFPHLENTEDTRCFKRAALVKVMAAIVLYTLGVVSSCWSPMTALGFNIAVAAMYFLPDAWLRKKCGTW